MRNYILVVTLFISSITIAQDAKEVIRRCNKNLLQIKDYYCKAHIDFDIPGLNIEKIDGTIYYKRPNKFRIKSNGIIFMPKQNPNQILNIMADTNAFMPVFIAKETVNGLVCDIIQMVPLKENDIAAAKIYIDAKGYIQKAEITSKENGTAMVNNKFDATSKYGMPCQTLITFDIKKFKVPKMVSVELNAKTTAKPTTTSTKTTGSIKITYTSYLFNTKFSDTVFTDK
ncbi:MAG: hypothetical protein WCP57_01085 [Bacteroidota bacterium]